MRHAFIFNPFRYATKPQNDRANVYDSADQYLIHIEAAGFEKEDITIDFEDDVLSVQAEKEPSLPEGFNGTKPHMRTISRRFQFHKNIDKEHIEATLTNGILAISLKKSTKGAIAISVS